MARCRASQSREKFISHLIEFLGNYKRAYYLLLMSNTAPSNTLGALLIDSARLLRQRFDLRARALGLTRAQWNVLSHLYRNEGVNQAGLADLMEIEPITVGRQLDRMEEAGWIARRPDPADRRVRRIFMTAQAQGVLDHMRELSRDIYAEALEGIAPDARDLLMSSLTQLRANLSDRSCNSESARPLPDQSGPDRSGPDQSEEVLGKEVSAGN
jgi:MarR family transcriptional regulator, transcriptional regulator for hemolysin